MSGTEVKLYSSGDNLANLNQFLFPPFSSDVKYKIINELIVNISQPSMMIT